MAPQKKINYYFDTDISLINPSIVHVMKMCQAFAKNNCDVTLCCTGDPETVDMDAIFRAYGVEKPFKVRMSNIPRWLKKYGHRFAHWYGAWKKAQMQTEDSFVYARSMMSVFFLRKKYQYVYEVHAEPDMLNRQFERCILRNENCRSVVAISQALKKRYLELFPFFPEEKVTVLHDAADLDTTASETKANLYGERADIKIGYVGSLFPGKCMETLLPLAKECSQYQFHIVGGTEYWIDYWKKRAQMERVDNLFFYGFVDNSDLGNYYRAFDISILPFSRDIYTGKSKRVNIGKWTSPLKLFEAMAYGKPILVSRLSTIEEVLVDGEDCVMVDPDNIGDWAQKLEMLCNDSELRARIGDAACKKLEREYTWMERAKNAASLFE